MIKAFKAGALGLSLLLANVSVCSAQDYEKGLEAGKKGDYAAELRKFRPLAEKGNAHAATVLGTFYENGQGVTQDYKEAVKWYRLAANEGNANAQVNLGVMYERGQGVTQDYKEAVRLYGLAAEQSDEIAQRNLGAVYVTGKGVIQDNVYAHMWLNIAPSSGDAEAVKYRDIVAMKMTAADISKAQGLARECVKKNYRGC